MSEILNLFDEENPIQKKPKMKYKDWKGDTTSIFKQLASSNHTEEERKAFDYYATDPIAGEHLMNLEIFQEDIWEPACGEGHLSKVFLEYDYRVKSSDLIERGFGEKYDFLSIHNTYWKGDIITNPPYTYAKEFVEKSLQIIENGSKVAMFLKLTFLEGKGRSDFFRENPPKIIYVSRGRINCAKNGDFKNQRISGGSAVCYAWFIWEKGFKEDTILRWFN